MNTAENDYRVSPIGILHTPHRVPARTPIQPVFAHGCQGRAELRREYAAGLDDLDGFSHLILLYWFHRSGSSRLHVQPFLDPHQRGIFATRAPCRPNPIGISIVRLVGRQDHVLLLEEVDMLDGTPLLDIKPYVERFDVRTGTISGWQEKITDATARKLGAREVRVGRVAGRSRHAPLPPREP